MTDFRVPAVRCAIRQSGNLAAYAFIHMRPKLDRFTRMIVITVVIPIMFSMIVPAMVVTIMFIVIMIRMIRSFISRAIFNAPTKHRRAQNHRSKNSTRKRNPQRFNQALHTKLHSKLCLVNKQSIISGQQHTLLV